MFTWQVHAMIVLCSFIDLIGFNFRNIAFQCASSGFCALMGYVIVFYGFLADVFWFGIAMTAVAIAGAVLIMVVTLTTAAYKLKQEKPKVM